MPFDTDDTTETPTRRGGGPPGGSSFLSSRLRQSAEAREADLKRQQEAAFGTAETADFRYETATTTTTTTSAEPAWSSEEPSWAPDAPSWDATSSWDAEEPSWATTSRPVTNDAPAAAATPAAEYDWEPTRPTPAAEPAPESSLTKAASFPGGRVKLPLLGESPDNPDLTFVGTAFVRRPGDDGTDQNSGGAFEEYFTYESLFDQPIAEPLRTDSSLEGDDPYHVLGVDPEAPWREIVSAHRALVKTHHPDRLIGASPQQLAHSEEALRLVNRAYSELRRRGRDIEDDA
jgi:hypothetical protein